MLALSATPGKDMEKVQEVVHKMKITHMEVRTDEDPDVKPYIKTKLEEVLEVSNAKPGTKVDDIRKKYYSAAIQPFVERLRRAGLPLPGSLSKGQVFRSYESFKAGGHRGCPPGTDISACHEAFSALLSLTYASDLLQNYGLEEFVKQFEKFVKSL